MNRKVLLAVLALGAVLLATPYVGTAQATPPTPVLFGAPFGAMDVVSPPEYRQNGPNWVLHAGISMNLIGDIVGVMTSDAYWIYRDWVGPYEDLDMSEVGAVHGHVLLNIDPATVGDKTGTIILRFNDVDPDGFAGSWVIIRGTGELKGIHGQGTWVIPGFVGVVPCQAFEGQIHFDP